MKVIRNIFLLIWTIFCIIGVVKNYSNYDILDVIVILIIVSLPYLIVFLFSKKKRNKSVPTPPTVAPTNKPETADNVYIETVNGTIFRADREQIQNEEIPYLMQIDYEKALNYTNTSKNPKFHRTPKEEELSYQFFIRNAAEADRLSDKFMDLYRSAYHTDDLSERIRLLHESIVAFEKAKKYCYSKGKGGTIYFQDMWEYMHNSQNECYSYLDNINNSLNEALYERDTIIPGIIDAVKEYDGILQKDIYAKLPNINKTDIQRIIRKLESENVLIRKKKSNSYELHLIK